MELEPVLEEPPSGQTVDALGAVAGALRGWVASLLDLTGRNDLLNCKLGSKLDLSLADPAEVHRLLAGEPVRMTGLFPDAIVVASQVKIAKGIRKRAREADEEFGVRVARLVSGFVTWTSQDASRSWSPNAPLLLRYVTLSQPQPGVDDFVLRVDADVEVNQVLLHLLDRDYHVRPSDEHIAAIADLAMDDFYPASGACKAFAGLIEDVPGGDVAPGLAAGTFKYQKLPMVNDLQQNVDLFAQSDLVAAVAGNMEAMTRIRSEVGTVTRTDPDFIPPTDEFLVLDADPSQNYALNAVMAGRNIIIQGPPGTGKSQTISNIIAASVARGKSVLFVAEKRAAIDAVLDRLDAVGLGSLVLDLHDGASNKGRIVGEIRESISSSGQVTRPNVGEIHHKLERSRRRLLAHSSALHRLREPWAISVFDAQSVVLGTPKHLKVDYRLPASTLQQFDEDTLRSTLEKVEDAAALGAFAPLSERSPWATATSLTEADTAPAYETARHLARETLPAALTQQEIVTEQTHLVTPDNTNEWTDRFAMLERSQDVLGQWRPEVWTTDLEPLVRGCAPRSERKAKGWEVSWGERRAARKAVKALRVVPVHTRDLYEGLNAVRQALAAWRAEGPDPDAVPISVELVQPLQAQTELVEGLAALSTYLHRPDIADLPQSELAELLTRLASDPTEVVRAQRVNSLLQQLSDMRLGGFIEALRDRGSNWTPEQAKTSSAQMLKYVWSASLLEQIALTDPGVGGFDGTEHHLVAGEFISSDRSHIAITPQRILRVHAERLVDARNAAADQDQVLDVELRRRRRIKPIRSLMALAPGVITAAKPCWAMSPLVVSEALPPDVKFDIVVFDEASQIRPADAVPALGRAMQAVICGDSKQLPPSTQFDVTAIADDGDGSPTTSDGHGAISSPTNLAPLSEDSESILDVFEAALGSRLADEYRLVWHYRSRDARLIAFCNAWFYDGSLLTFPGTALESPLIYVPAAHPAGQPQNVANEVATVVDLALEHARTRPDESLGIIAMGIEHATRVEAALEQRLREEDDPTLRAYFRESAEHPFFVKNLERVQGDERDAIIITMGYVKGTDGRMRYTFGPINNKGGERRLNVAFSRAKNRLTLVSSFTAEDLDPGRLNSEGGKALRAYLQYAASGGADLGDLGASLRPLNPFEIHVRDRLRLAGLQVTPQYGVAGYWLDFAASHPERPGQMVLAIEADGAAYHSSETARARDRLRQEHLERLGWTFHRIWSTDYFRDPDRETARAVAAFEAAVAAADSRRVSDISEQPIPVERVTGVAQPKPMAPRRQGRLPVTAGLSITEYSDQQLQAAVAWVMSDDLVRTNDELLEEAMVALGFQRRGSRIVGRLNGAIVACARAAR